MDVGTYECVDVKIFFQNFHISCYSAIWNKETFIYTSAVFFDVLTEFDKTAAICEMPQNISREH